MNASTDVIEGGDPALDPRAFRRCLGQFATGVTVITALHGVRVVGMTINSFAALSLDPPLILWSIRKDSASLGVFREASHFAVNVLAANQVEVSNTFATPGEEKFRNTPCDAGRFGSPLLAGRIAEFECVLERAVDAGDHLLMIGLVKHFARRHGEPLLFTQGRYAATREHPAVAETSAFEVAVDRHHPADVEHGSLLRLLHYSSNQMSAAFGRKREEAQLSVAELRLYGWLRPQPRTIEQLKHLAYLGGRDTEDTVASMLLRGDLRRDSSGLLSLTDKGRARADDMSVRVEQFEREMVNDLSAQDLAATRRVLGTLAQRANPQGSPS